MPKAKNSSVDLMKQTEIRWKELADATRNEADKLPPGRARDALMKRVRQLEIACHMSEWISSAGLKAPL